MRSCDLTFELTTVLANRAVQRTGGRPAASHPAAQQIRALAADAD